MPGERMDTLRTPGIGRGEPVSIFVNGEETRAFEGETVLAALWAAGERTLHTTARTQEPRGFFCGMGVCFDCLVTIDGAYQCACLSRAGARRNEDHVAARRRARPCTLTSPSSVSGPAGMAAAVEAAEAGATRAAARRIRQTRRTVLQASRRRVFRRRDAAHARASTRGGAARRNSSHPRIRVLTRALVWGRFGERADGLSRGPHRSRAGEGPRDRDRRL